MVNNDRRYRDTVSADTRNLAGLKGKFGDLLLSGSRGQGALDAAGLGGGLQRYNSTASIGDILNRQSGYNEALQGALVNANTNEQQILASNAQDALRMQYGSANSDLDYARQQQSGAMQGFSNLLSQVPSLFPQTPGVGPERPGNPGIAPTEPSFQPNFSFPETPSSPGMQPEMPPNHVGAGYPPTSANPMQSSIQKLTSGFSPAGNSMGPAYNGGFNGRLPKIGRPGAYTSPIAPPAFAGY